MICLVWVSVFAAILNQPGGMARQGEHEKKKGNEEGDLKIRESKRTKWPLNTGFRGGNHGSNLVMVGIV
jgi:hypothetical protein